MSEKHWYVPGTMAGNSHFTDFAKSEYRQFGVVFNHKDGKQISAWGPATYQMTELWCESDLESDDKLALALLVRSGKWNIDTLVVGERNPSQLYDVAQQYCKLLKQDAKIIIGQGSSVVFKDEGKEFNEIKWSETKESKESYESSLVKFLTDRKEPHMLMIKPCRELFQIWDKKEVRELLSKTIAYFYGSFNMRVVLGRKYSIENRKRYLEMLAAFKQVYWFESFHSIAERGQNSMNHKNMPKFYKWLDSEDNLAQHLKKAAEVWTRHLLVRQKDTSSKLYKDLSADVHQFVLADIGSACCMIDDSVASIPCDIEILDSGYTKLEPNEKSNIRAYFHIPWQFFENIMIKVLT